MAAGSTYTPIATGNIGGASTLSFSSIPQTYTDLVLVVQGSNSNVGNLEIRLNGDQNSNYSATLLGGNGTSAASTRLSNYSPVQVNWYGYFDSSQSVVITNFMNYSNTTTYKTYISRSSNASNGTAATVALWRDTNAITLITLLSSNGNFDSGTTATLYGIAAA